jgi:hypothetical protein
MQLQGLSEVLSFTDQERVALSAALVYMDSSLIVNELDHQRRQKKWRVVEKRREVLGLLGVPKDQQVSDFLRASSAGWADARRNLFLVELAFTEPFAPYELDFDDKDRHVALGQVAELIGLPPTRADEVLDSMDSARKAHRHIAWGRIAVAGVLGAATLAFASYLAAPVIAAQLGAAAGLSGAAAVSHGLALIGGGSLAAGGSGMAGGLWLVTGVGASAGAVQAAGGVFLYNLGTNAAAAELVKLQVTFHQVILHSQFEEAKKAAVIGTLVQQQAELRAQLLEEQEMNERNSRRLDELEKLIGAYDDSIRWMKEREQAAEAVA